MPQVVPAIAGAVGSFVGGIFGTGAGIIAAKATIFALTYVLPGVAATVIGKALSPKLGGAVLNPSPLQLGRGSDEPRIVVYGETRLAGKLIDGFVGGANNEFLHLACVVAGHECEAIGTVWFNDETVPLDGSGNATGTYAGFARVKKHLGAAGQTADADFVSESAGARSSSDKFTACAWIYPRLKWDQAKWPAGMPTPTALVKGRKVYDPRTGLTAWSDNPALIWRDYMTNTDFGIGAAADEIDDASVIAAANVCDELVSLAAGGTEKRYRCNGSFERSEGLEPGSVIDKIVESMAGWQAYIGGKWEIHAGAWETPTVTLDEDDLRGPIDVQTDLSLAETCNRVRGKFISPADGYQPVDFTPIVNALYLSEDGGLEIWHDMDLAFVHSQSQAQRIAKIMLELTRQGITVQMPCKLTAFRVKAGSIVLIKNAECGWTGAGKPFRVEKTKFTASTDNEAGGITLDFDLSLREIAAECFDWNNGEETTYDPAANTTLWDAKVVETPAGYAATVAAPAERTAAPRVKLTNTLPVSQFIRSGGWIEHQYKKAADPAWIDWSRVPGSQTVEFITDLQVGTSTQFRARFVNSAGVPGAYCAPVSATPQAGEASYIASLTNGRHLVRANAEGAVFAGELGVGGRATTDCKAWAGNVPLAAVASAPAAGQFSVSAAVVEGTATFTKEDADTFRLDTLTTDRTIVRLTFDLEGLSTRTEDWILWKNTDGGAYWLLASAAAVNKSQALAYTPTAVLFSSKAILSIAGLANYSGRFKIATWNGSTWTDVYTSSGDEASTSFTVPAGSFTKFRCQLYKAGGFSTFLDEIEVPIVYDGPQGPPGADGDDGAPGSPGAPGASAYGLSLTNGRHLVRANAEGTVFAGELGSGGRATTDCKAWLGATALAAVASGPGAGQFSVSGAVVEGTATFTKEDADTFRLDTLTTDRTIVRLTFDLEGLSTRTEDWILWKNTDGGAYWLLASAAAVNKSQALAYTPTAVLFSAKAILSVAGVANYSGRFKIATWNGSTWTDVYTSSGDEASTSFTVPAGTFTKFRCQLYKAGGFSTFLDEIEVPIVYDGPQGPPGADGDDGAPGSPGSPGSDGTDGATVLGSAGGGGSAASSSYTNISPDLTLGLTCDGTTRILKFSAAYVANASGSAQTCHVAICDGTTVIAELGNGQGVDLDPGKAIPIEFSVSYTPSAGAHTFRIRVKGSGGNSVATGGYLEMF